MCLILARLPIWTTAKERKRRLSDHDRTNRDAIKDVQFRITFTAPEGHDNQWAT
jgi:hypothetical protein